MMWKCVIRFLKKEEGATMLEYGLMVALIAVVSIAAIGALGGSVVELFGSVNEPLAP
jgi:pilus assembly protein Flp/PilA